MKLTSSKPSFDESLDLKLDKEDGFENSFLPLFVFITS